jgi:ABC-type spermidine/putrescine transport system permease subunit I
MTLMQSAITLLYQLLIGFVAVLLIWNLIRSKKWEEEILLVIVVVPFLLRVLGLK